MPPPITESFRLVCAGLFVSLVKKYMLNNPKLDSCCQTAAPEEIDNETDDTTKYTISDTLSKASAITTATLPPPHPTHTHHVYDVHHKIYVLPYRVNTSTTPL